MCKNLREIIMNRIANVICDSEYMEQLDTAGKRPALEELDILHKLLSNTTRDDLVNVKGNGFYIDKALTHDESINSACSTCSSYLKNKAIGGALICNCTLGLPTITSCYNGHQSNIG